MSQAQRPDSGPVSDYPSRGMARHRRESFWQVILPMLVVLLAVGAVFVIVVLSGREGISGAADLSLVLVGFLLFIFAGLPVLLVLLGLLVAMSSLLDVTPSAARVAQDASARVSGAIVRFLNRVTDAIIGVLAGFAAVQHLLNLSDQKGSRGPEPGPTDSDTED